MGARETSLRGNGPTYRENVSSAEIKSDIDRTRRNMDDTLDRLEARLSPRHLLDDLLGYFNISTGSTRKGGRKAMRSARHASQAVIQQVRDNPVPALLIGAGLAWLIYENSTEDEEEVELELEIEDEAPRGRSFDRGAHYTEPYTTPMAVTDRPTPRIERPGAAEAVRHSILGDEETEEHGRGLREKAGDMAASARAGAEGAAESAKAGASRAAHAVKSGASSAAESVKGAAGAVSGKAKEAGAAVGSAASAAAHRTGEAARHAGEKAAEYAHEAAHLAKRAGSRVSHGTRAGYAYSRERFEDAVDQYPLAVGAGFLALGLLLGLALPETRREDEWLGEASDEAKEKAKRAGKDVMARGEKVVGAAASAATEAVEREELTPGDLADKARHVLEQTKETAEEEGITPSALKEKAAHVAEEAREAAISEARKQTEDLKHEAHEVKEEAEHEFERKAEELEAHADTSLDQESDMCGDEDEPPRPLV